MAEAANNAILMATGALYRMRCAGDDIEARPQVYAELLATDARLRDLVSDFVQSWRTSSATVAMCALMARRSGALKFDPIAFLRLLARDIRENPGTWAGLVQTQPRFAEDSARLARSLREALATNTPTAYA